MFARWSRWTLLAKRKLFQMSPNDVPSVFRRLERPFLLPILALLALCVLYTVAEYHLTRWCFAVYGYVWRPAFPWSWRLVFLLLCAVPAFSLLQLLSLSFLARHRWRRGLRSGPSQGYTMLPRNEASNSLDDRRPSNDDEDCDEDEDVPLGVQGDGGPTRPHPPPRRQTPRHPTPSDWTLQFASWLVLFCISFWIGLSYRHPGDLRYLPLIQKATARPDRAGYANQEKIFIAAMFYDNEQILPYWSDSLVKVVRYLGEDNVFVSIVENASKDRSPALLRALDERLGGMNVARRILIQDDAIPRPVNVTDNHNLRVYFLAALRNRALQPLVEMGGYDKVIFSNDIFVEPESIVELLNTADGEYDMACGMDFGNWGLYDLWVLRDKRGKLAGSIWPYFFDMESYEAMQSESPVPVFACWNGIVVFQADPVLPIHLRSNRTLSTEPLPFKIPDTHPAVHNPSARGPSPALTPPARFRATAPGECFSSECFLLPYDFRRIFNLQRIYVNPRVIVAYDWRFYKYYKWILRHPVLKWWIEKVYDGAWMQKDVLVVGNNTKVTHWDGGDCHPWTD